ncbi:MAG: tRNA uridine-5-carboxymethylaminomethyl(34) synthesis enzyme MnmG [Firmicutes bacterium]|nr:tRNA uridine-5-carboxymethylaminomethyl(34) synthesis enzyme MnmG [Bacillota bacterium]
MPVRGEESSVYGRYDVIVVGAGHAGCEAGLAAARMGCRTLVLTINLDNVGWMPCNPAIGGPAKSHLVREVDALGGEMGKNIDKTYVQIRMLNTRKGPAVHSLRAQADRVAYHVAMKEALEKTSNLELKQAIVTEVVSSGDRVAGVRLKTGTFIAASTVVLTTGTYLGGRIHIGEVNYESGPHGQHAASELSESLRALGFTLMRFKTGTPPRVDRRSLDFGKMEIQPGHNVFTGFSFREAPDRRDFVGVEEQIPCWLTYTSPATHEVIARNMFRAPVFSGAITGVGPRYCPSIETKVAEFPDKPRHQIFIEPEGWHTYEMYVSGLSTSLPEDVQIELLHTIPGLEHAVVMRLGYAIEYDCLDPAQLTPSLETKAMEGLFTAGQINGSSGYEEAAAQGIIAGINAALRVEGREPFILDRSDAYIGVLIDDLVTKGTHEPYRMLTTRAEYRLLLRQDNADLRLTEKGHALGLVDDEHYRKFVEKRDAILREEERLRKTVVNPGEDAQEVLAGADSASLQRPASLAELLKRPELTYRKLAPLDPERPHLPAAVVEEVELQLKYEGYISRQSEQVERFKKMEGRKIPPEIDYKAITGLSTEAREKLSKIHPYSLGQASRISGVSPADLSVLAVCLEQRRRG